MISTCVKVFSQKKKIVTQLSGDFYLHPPIKYTMLHNLYPCTHTLLHAFIRPQEMATYVSGCLRVKKGIFIHLNRTHNSLIFQTPSTLTRYFLCSIFLLNVLFLFLPYFLLLLYTSTLRKLLEYQFYFQYLLLFFYSIKAHSNLLSFRRWKRINIFNNSLNFILFSVYYRSRIVPVGLITELF